MGRPTRLLKKVVKRVHGIGAMNVGRIGSARPLSAKWGLDRGTPIDRYYIEAFVARHSSDVKGDVLEVKHDDYSSRIGGEKVKRLDIISLEADNPSATIIGDLADPATLPSARFDCVILTQTLHLIFDMPVALANIRQALRPGGVALITVPGITPILSNASFPWYWSLSQQALHKLLMQQLSTLPFHPEISPGPATASRWSLQAVMEPEPECRANARNGSKSDIERSVGP